ncbi:putative MSP1-intra-mitochondrial sorting protein [Endogone sp. FLAS-F59071]|nr:putative MSP1-intra-mitochondrial sorting protein [Endogone sp. FLAS-F59071]|eukprot:RUS22220.1 putative MSP1-intra-mitochondrial sorting protein [Endogone sp. FLAS-F59071]
MQPTTKKYVADVAIFAISQVALYFAFKYILNSLDPSRGKRNEAKLKSNKVLGRLGVKDLKLSEYEEVIATEVVHPEEIKVAFDQIGGLDSIIQDLKESVILPLRYPQLFTSASGLLGAPKGVLLYGPPGCGKTMLAKALARESNATFINLHISTLTDKWFGESNKLVSGLFSLAKKLQPSIIFIDEIDSFLRERRSNDHEITGMMKAEFMSLWDGLTTGEDTRILVLGATNRPNDIDQAILRRMPKRFAIKLPNESQRRGILEIMLNDIKLDPSLDVEQLVLRTDGCSGSDLKEICRNAAMIPVREYVRKAGVGIDVETLDIENIEIRPLLMDDFFAVNVASANETNGAIAAAVAAATARAKDEEMTLEQEIVD